MNRQHYPQTRVVLRGQLVAQTPLHVGGAVLDPNSDQPLARDGQGRFLIPGTSIAGALRDWCTQHFKLDQVEQLFGKLDAKNPNDSHASRIYIEDIPIANEICELRDGVQLDRRLGTAAEKLKYDRVVLPRGTILELCITAEPFDAAVPAAEMLAALQVALTAGEIRLGACKTRGLGKVKLQKATLEHYANLTKPGGILARLLAEGQPLNVQPLQGKTQDRVAVEIHWRPVGPLMVKASHDGVGADMLPLVSTDAHRNLKLVLPGSSIKGALRARAERIMRTLLPDIKQCADPLDQLDVILVDRLFGFRATKKTDDRGLAALSIDDCYADLTFKEERWAQVEATPRKQEPDDFAPTRANDFLDTTLMRMGLHLWKVRDHVAIDRWTGGAAEGMLFSVLEPHQVTWEPLRLTLQLRRLPQVPNGKEAGLFLLLLVLRDLANHWLPLGFATNRGMGDLEVTQISLHSDWLPGLQNLNLANGDVAPLAALLDDPWQKWLSQNGAQR